MSLLKRLKNLWVISSYEVTKPNEVYHAGTTIASLFKKNQQAQIVDMADVIKELKID